jgi:hypothetical protein
MNTAPATDTLARVQDELCARLTSGKVAAAELPAAYAAHVAALTAAGFAESEAQDCFFDALATARHAADRPEPITPDGIYTTADAARVLSMHPESVTRLLRAGVLRGSRRLGRWRMRGADLLKIA